MKDRFRRSGLTIAAIAVLVFIAGCTSTRTIRPGVSGATATIEQRAEDGETATVRLKSGQSVAARTLEITPETVTFISPGGVRRRVPTPDVCSVRFTRRGRGALYGGAIGGTAGALSMVVGGAIELPPAAAVLYAPVFAIAGGIVGAPLGALVGAIRGHRDLYRFEDTPGAGPDNTC